MSSRELWVFGYGSLIWRPDFPFAEQRAGFVSGWARRFWQGSTDHRGVPGSPGRVVTLVRDMAERTWGTAYRIDPAQREDVLSHLDYREKGGYAREDVAFHHGGGQLTAMMYLATPDNPNYLGPAPAQAIARTISNSHGPSGPNREYLLRLAEALREMGADDPHVFELEQLVRGSGDGPR